jgi:hypothetical protein
LRIKIVEDLRIKGVEDLSSKCFGDLRIIIVEDLRIKGVGDLNSKCLKNNYRLQNNGIVILAYAGMS